MTHEATITDSLTTDLVEKSIPGAPTAAETTEANETHDYKRPGKVKMYGYTLLTAIGAQAALVSGAFGGNKKTESQPLMGENQVVLVNFIPKDFKELGLNPAAIDSQICEHAKMEDTFTQTRGWPGWRVRWMPSINGNAACPYEIKDVYMSKPDSTFSTIEGASATFYDELTKQPDYNANYYYDSFYAAQSWPNPNKCDVSFTSNSPFITLIPTHHNLGVTKLNKFMCDQGFKNLYGFIYTQDTMFRIMAGNFAFPSSNDPKDVMYPNIGNTWAGVYVRQNERAYRLNSYFSFQVDASNIGPGTVNSTTRSLATPPYPGGVLDTRPDGSKAAPGAVTLEEDAVANKGAHFVRWDVQGPNPTNGPDIPPYSSAPYETINIADPANPHLEIKNVDRSLRIRGIFAPNSQPMRTIQVFVRGTLPRKYITIKDNNLGTDHIKLPGDPKIRVTAGRQQGGKVKLTAYTPQRVGNKNVSVDWTKGSCTNIDKAVKAGSQLVDVCTVKSLRPTFVANLG